MKLSIGQLILWVENGMDEISAGNWDQFGEL